MHIKCKFIANIITRDEEEYFFLKKFVNLFSEREEGRERQREACM